MDNKLEYWTKYCMQLIKKSPVLTKPTAIKEVIVLPGFIRSEITEDQLGESMDNAFKEERAKIVDKMRQKLKEVRKNSN